MRNKKRFVRLAAFATAATLTAGAARVLAGPVPLLSYTFDEGSGVTAPNSGSALSYNSAGGLLNVSPPAQLFTGTGTVATDLHGAAGSGVTGAASDYALDLSAVGGMGSTYNGSSMARITRPAIQSLQSFTLSGWLKPDEIVSSNARLFSLSDSTGAVATYVSATSNGVLGFNVGAVGTASPAVYNSVGQWMYFAITYDGTKSVNNTVFYEGTAGPTGTLSAVATNTVNAGTVAAMNMSSYFLYVGNTAGANRQYDGLMDDIQVYGSATDSTGALSAASVQSLFAATGTGTPTWSTNGSGDWNSAANWFGTVPNAIGAKASLASASTSNNVVYTTAPVTVGTLTFNNSSAAYEVNGSVGTSLTFQVSTGSALVDVQAGTHELNLPLTLASNTTFQTDASTAHLIIADPMTINSGITLTTSGTGSVTYVSTVTLQSGAMMNMSSSSYAHALALAANSAATLTATTPGSKTVLQLDSLSDAGILNMANNDLVIHAGSLSAVTASIASGYNGGNWNGSGITSTSAASDSTHLHALGIASAATAGTFDGVSVAAGDVLLKYTYYGDTNLDGKVDGSDYSKIDNAYLADKTNPTAYTGWANGDLNYDSVINGSDYTLIDNAFNTQGAQISAEIASPTAQIAGSSSVPEPATLGLLATGVTALLGRRRRCK